MKIQLTTSAKAAYKFKLEGGKWTPLLHFLKESGGNYFFKPVEDTKSTEEIVVHQFYIAAAGDLETAKQYTKCVYYDTWEKASHVCGTDCPLGKII